jgi:hypothetical protein
MTAEIAIANLQRLRVEVEDDFGIENRYHSTPDTTNVLTSPTPTDQGSAETLANEFKTDYNAHIASVSFHLAADGVNTITSANATDLATLLTLCTEIRLDYNAHRSQAGCHVKSDTRNVISTAAPGNLSEALAFLIEAKADYNAHIGETNTHAWTDIEASDIELARERQTHRRIERTQRLTQIQSNVLGRRGCNLSFGHYLKGDGVALDTGASASDDSLQTLLGTALGGSYSAAGSTTAAGCTTTVLNVQGGHGARFRAGTAIMVAGTGRGGRNEMSVIRSISTDAITLEIALTNAPPASRAVYNSYTAYVDPAATQTLQALLTGDATADVFIALGLAGGITFSDLLQTDNPARVMFALAGASWDDDVDTLAAATYDGADPLGTAEEVEICWEDHGTQTRSLISCSALDVVPGVTWTHLYARGNADVDHCDRVRLTKVEPTASLTSDVDADFLADYEAQAVKMLTVMNGRTAGSSWCLCIPRCVISAPPPRAIHGEQTANTIQIAARENDAGDASTALMRSPIFISRL